MFKREENPYLFDTIKKEYENAQNVDDFYERKRLGEIKKDITDDQLDTICYINFDVLKNGVKLNLNGIEELQNLKCIVLNFDKNISFDSQVKMLWNTFYDVKNMDDIHYIVGVEDKENGDGIIFDLKKKTLTLEGYNGSIYKTLKRSRDLSKSNYEKFDVNCEFALDSDQDYDNVLKTSQLILDLNLPLKLVYDMPLYFKISKQNPEFLEKLDNALFYVTEDTFKHNKMQMDCLKKMAQTTVSECQDSDLSDIEKIECVYNCVRDIIKYDTKNYFLGSNKKEEIECCVEDIGYELEAVQDRLMTNNKFSTNDSQNLKMIRWVYQVFNDNLECYKSYDDAYCFDMIRSPYFTALRRQGVCVGISNLFNTLMLEMGYNAEPEICSKQKVYNGQEYILDHQISKVFIPNEGWKYFDITSDLGAENNRFFALSEDEIKASCVLEKDKKNYDQSQNQILADLKHRKQERNDRLDAFSRG